MLLLGLGRRGIEREDELLLIKNVTFHYQVEPTFVGEQLAGN
jgi:hypothetical protein